MKSHQTSLKRELFQILDDHKSHKPMNRLFHGILFTLIILSSILLIVESVKSFHRSYFLYLYPLEVFTMIFFSIEYLLRVYTCTEIKGYKHPIIGRMKYIMTPLMLIDILSIIPFYLIIFSSNYSGFYIFSIFRVLRLFKAIRYVEAFKIIGRVFYIQREQLLVSFIFIIFVFVFASSIIYIAEKDAQPYKFSDIPSAMWYTVATITTVGYGDVYPITLIGKITGGLISMSGLLLFAIPTSILTSGFLKLNREKQNEATEVTCPSCGETFDK
ncbi:MAG: ion transporter [Bacteroidia bacterium]|nr:ion transporter [Bacteroidia bacterium]